MVYRRTVGRSRSRGRRSSRSFRRPLWVRATHSSAALTGAVPSYGVSLVPDAELDAGARLGSTISRVHLDISVSTPPLSAATAITFGMAVHDVTDFGDNTQPPINPYTQEDAVSWMLWRWLPTVPRGIEVGLQNVTGGHQIAYHFDVKTKRVLAQPQENLILVLTSLGVQWSGINVASSTLLHLA